MDSVRIDHAAALLGEARRDNRAVTLPRDLYPDSENTAYAVQAALHRWQRENGQGDIAGYKIGCTTPVMREVLRIDSPAFGGVLKYRIFQHRATFSFADFQGPGIECEVAVRLAADLSLAGAPYSRDTVAPAIGACMAAIELVDNRYGDFLSAGAAVMMADDFFQSACILGAEVPDWRGLDLADTEGRTFINGKLVGSGLGSDVLGHPLEAVAWLANRLAVQGRSLSAGELIMTGSLTAVQWIDAAPAEAVISIDGLGDVAVRLA